MKLVFLFFILSLFGGERASSHPYLSGDTWRFFCDWVLSEDQNFNPQKVEKGDTIFVEYGRLHRFSHYYLPRIRNAFILITPNAENGSDAPLPGKFESLVKSPKVFAWFLQNIDRLPSKKLIPLPIGLANRIWPHGEIQTLSRFIELDGVKKEHLAYVNFCIGTNEKKRAPCFAQFQDKSWAKIADQRTFATYLEDLKKTVFVISPPGNGLDCHRTWEALYMNCYPVVLSSTLDPLYKGLPVVIVKDWSEVTEELLEEKREEFSKLEWSQDELYADFWFEKVKKLQDKLRKKWFLLF